jgi:hypothetical protein
MEPLLCLLPSPLLGPAAWRPVARQLSQDGWSVAEVPRASSPPQSSDDVIRALLSALPADRDVILVPHSNAGLYVPTLIKRLRAIAYVFVDAGLPSPGGQVPLAPAPFYDFLARQADENGMLPPWTQWWDEDISGLFPSARVREQVEREQHRLPLSYFAESLPAPEGWDDKPGAYLAFGDTYAAERADAAARGWKVATLPGEHLHTLINPQEVAAAIGTLLAQLGLGSVSRDSARGPGSPQH